LRHRRTVNSNLLISRKWRYLSPFLVKIHVEIMPYKTARYEPPEGAKRLHRLILCKVHTMLDLSLTRDQMLVALNLPQNVERKSVTNPSDPCLITMPVAHLIVRFHHRDDVYPALKIAFKQRFANMGRDPLRYHLTRPLRYALGNAFKHGNRQDRSKWMELEAFVTFRGVFLSLSDQGDGFHVEEVLRKFMAGHDYATYQGAGFKVFNFSWSQISFSNGGKTFLLLFLVEEVM